jgi:hypothetical protein
MSIKTGLRALAVGAAMVCGVVSAEAATWQLPILGGSGSFTIEGDITDTTMLTFELFTYYWPAIITRPNDYYALNTNINLYVPGTQESVALLGPPTSYFYRGTCNVFPCEPTYYDAISSYSKADITVTSEFNIINYFYQSAGVPSVYFGGGTLLLTLPDGLAPSIGTVYPTTTPLPGALPLFASVLGIGGWLGLRRKRLQNQSVPVAA